MKGKDENKGQGKNNEWSKVIEGEIKNLGADNSLV